MKNTFSKLQSREQTVSTQIVWFHFTREFWVILCVFDVKGSVFKVIKTKIIIIAMLIFFWLQTASTKKDQDSI